MDKIKSALKSPTFWAGFAVGSVATLAFGRFIPTKVKQWIGMIPGSDAKTSA